MAGIDAYMLKKLFLAGAHALNEQKEWINELNVFPVPDGDTGTNMTMTILAAAPEVLNQENDSMESVCRAISSGALRGARGNSGVILSQLFRGFFKEIRELDEIELKDLIAAVNHAVESAYKAVMKPKEGTILTVARGISEKSQEFDGSEDMEDYLRTIIACGDEVLQKTPEMLPVLKQAGVVDSGGQGLMVILHGILDAFLGKEVDMTLPVMAAPKEGVTIDTSDIETADIKFGYCTEFIIKLEQKFTEQDEVSFKAYLESIGDSIVCVADEEIVKIHVHTNDPGLAIQKALTYGQLSRMKIDNMREEHEERLFKNAEKLAAEQKAGERLKAVEQEPRKAVGFVAVCAGEGLTAIFKDMGVDQVISGGQTMNPSTEDLLSAIRCVNADTVFVLPNNKNIILAANQAAFMTEDKNVIVIPSGTVCEGISCMLSYVPEAASEENEAAMKEQMAAVKTIEVTYAVRDTFIDETAIHKDDFMALSGKHILACGKEISEVVKEAVAKTVDDDSALVTLYYGENIQEEEAETLAETITPVLRDAEAAVACGGQPVYYFIISVE